MLNAKLCLYIVCLIVLISILILDWLIVEIKQHPDKSDQMGEISYVCFCLFDFLFSLFNHHKSTKYKENLFRQC